MKQAVLCRRRMSTRPLSPRLPLRKPETHKHLFFCVRWYFTGGFLHMRGGGGSHSPLFIWFALLSFYMSSPPLSLLHRSVSFNLLLSSWSVSYSFSSAPFTRSSLFPSSLLDPSFPRLVSSACFLPPYFFQPSLSLMIFCLLCVPVSLHYPLNREKHLSWTR